MKNFTYKAPPTQIYFGRDEENRIGEYMLQFGTKLLMVHYGDPFLKKSGMYDRIMESLRQAGITVTELTGIVPNPRIDKVREGVAICREQGVDAILAVGGGSVIDTAKAISAAVKIDGDPWDLFSGKAAFPEAGIPLGVILTTPATGSETNCNSVVSNPEIQKKVGIANPALYARLAVMNPAVTGTLPPFQTAAAGVDCMAHILEGYAVGQWDVELNQRIDEAVMQTVVHNLPILLAEPGNYNARAEMMWAGNIACKGILSCGSEIDATAHILGYELSARYDVNHGASMAAIMPAWLRFLSRFNTDRLARFAVAVWGCEYDFANPQRTAQQGVDCMERFFRQIGMPVSLSDLGLQDIDVTEIGTTAFDSIVKRMSIEIVSSIKVFTAEDYVEILRMAL